MNIETVQKLIEKNKIKCIRICAYPDGGQLDEIIEGTSGECLNAFNSIIDSFAGMKKVMCYCADVIKNCNRQNGFSWIVEFETNDSTARATGQGNNGLSLPMFLGLINEKTNLQIQHMKDMHNLEKKIDALSTKKTGSPFDSMLPLLAAKMFGMDIPVPATPGGGGVQGPPEKATVNKKSGADHKAMNKKIEEETDKLATQISGPDMLVLLEVANANPKNFIKLIKKVKETPVLIDQVVTMYNL